LRIGSLSNCHTQNYTVRVKALLLLYSLKSDKTYTGFTNSYEKWFQFTVNILDIQAANIKIV